jgi:hypothetical protein
MTLVMIARASYYRSLMMKMKADNALIPVAASISLVFGLILLVMHNFWSWHLDILVTLVTWVIVIKSILWLSLPERMLAMSKVIYSTSLFYWVAFLVGIVGVLLLTHTYFLFMPQGLVPQI